MASCDLGRGGAEMGELMDEGGIINSPLSGYHQEILQTRLYLNVQ